MKSRDSPSTRVMPTITMARLAVLATNWVTAFFAFFPKQPDVPPIQETQVDMPRCVQKNVPTQQGPMTQQGPTTTVPSQVPGCEQESHFSSAQSSANPSIGSKDAQRTVPLTLQRTEREVGVHSAGGGTCCRCSWSERRRATGKRCAEGDDGRRTAKS